WKIGAAHRSHLADEDRSRADPRRKTNTGRGKYLCAWQVRHRLDGPGAFLLANETEFARFVVGPAKRSEFVSRHEEELPVYGDLRAGGLVAACRLVEARLPAGNLDQQQRGSDGRGRGQTQLDFGELPRFQRFFYQPELARSGGRHSSTRAHNCPADLTRRG